MIVVLDTNAILSDPLITSTAWKILAHAARTWGVRVCTTEVVLVEASAGYKRRLDEALVGLKRWEDKHLSALASPTITQGLRERLDAESTAYGPTLRGALGGIPVDVLPIPSVSHEVLVARAANRVPPCDSNGDGYRDTLNWYSIIDLLDHAGGVFFVTADTDFASEGKLHPVLQREVEQVRASAEVHVIGSLPELALVLASEFAEVDEQDVKAIQARLQLEALTQFVTVELLRDLSAVPVSERSLALPLAAHGPVLAVLGHVSGGRVEVKAAMTQEESAVEVSFRADTTVLFQLPPESSLSPDIVEVLGGSDQRLVQTTKPLEYKALVTVDRFDHPSQGELISVRAPSDDPGHQTWHRAATNHLLQSVGGTRMSEIKIPPGTAEAIRRMSEIKIPPGTAEAIRRMSEIKIPPGTAEAIRRMSEIKIPPATAEAIRRMSEIKIPPATAEAIRRMSEIKIPPATAEAIRRMSQGQTPPPAGRRDSPSDGGEIRDAGDGGDATPDSTDDGEGLR